ncbi:hypothetical protein [Nocardia sp. NPDC052566]
MAGKGIATVVAVEDTEGILAGSIARRSGKVSRGEILDESGEILDPDVA